VVCAAAAECDGCDPIVRPARPSDRAARLDDQSNGAAALLSRAAFQPAPPYSLDLLPRASASVRAPLPVTSPLRL
ncbi:MAG TPA: hypothetical protein VN032_12005, partial [Thermoanaerobaculia bacterium]|nr:hypothetical protein [Thermoanaerobaculia bacterium]